jgi:Tol biopolymer transport system component/DNA-binding winged helix-turn-helix (wHTH) protein
MDILFFSGRFFLPGFAGILACSPRKVNRSYAGVCLNWQLLFLQPLAGSSEEIAQLLSAISGKLLGILAGVCGVKATSKRSSGVRFGQFDLNLAEVKLLKRGLPVRLENQPYQILAALLDRPGELVSREELCADLWPDGTYVDFDESLNTAVKKLRYALGDSPENPVFIETVPRRGYRFIAPVQDVGIQPLKPAAPGNGHQPLETPTDSLATPVSRATRTSGRLIALGIIVIAVCTLLYRAVFPPTLRVTQTVRLTNSSRVEPWGRITSDGSRLFFLEREGDHWNARQISVAGGESVPFGTSPRNTKIFDVSPDKSEMLFAPFTMRTPDLPLWSMPLVGGAPRRIGDILASAANFSPDGTRIAFTNTKGAFVANRDGSGLRQLADLSDCWSIAWSHDGKTLRFGQDHNGAHLWQVGATGHDLHPFLPSWSAGDGRWMPDGSYYVFAAAKDGQKALWALRESPSFPWLRQTPTQITFPPISFDNPTPSRDGRFIYADGGLSQQIDVVHFDSASHQFKPAIPGFNVTEVEFSPDHQWVLYTNWNQLWRSRPDGSDRLQLAGPPSIPHNYFAHWSPDSKHILFEDLEDGKSTIYLVSAEGGPAQQPLPPGPAQRRPNWSPDGQTLGFSIEEDAGATPPSNPGIYFFDLATGRSTFVAGSGGLIHPHWSPDGRFLAALSEDPSVIKLLDLRTHRWSEVARGTLISAPVWSADSVLYFQDLLAPGEPVYRFQPGSSSPQRAYSFEDILHSGAQRCAFQGFAPDGSLLVQVNRGGGDIYALTVSAP